MPDNKRHHYVPRFYLRNFSGSQEGKTIRLFNIKSARVIPEAGIDRQCYRNYLYGKNGKIESAFGDLEGHTATLFRELLAEDTEPKLDVSGFRTLVDFVALQHARTETAEKHHNELADKLGKFMLSRSKPELEGLDKVTIALTDAMLFSVRNAIMMRAILWDLAPILIEARNGAEFITSDNPVVLLNSFFDEPPVHSGVPTLGTLGWASLGLQIYFPISATRAIFLYDVNLYERQKTKVIPQPAYPIDVRQLNAIQYLNARENIYFASSAMDQGIAELHRDFSKLRVAEHATLTTRPVFEGGRRKGELLTVSHPQPDFRPNLRFVSPRRRLTGRLEVGVRNPSWVRIVREFAKAVESGREDFWDFGEYVEREFRRMFGNA